MLMVTTFYCWEFVFLENEMHCCMPWFKHVHDRIKEPNTTPTSIVASSQDTLSFCVFSCCVKKGERARPSPRKFEFRPARFGLLATPKLLGPTTRRWRARDTRLVVVAWISHSGRMQKSLSPNRRSDLIQLRRQPATATTIFGLAGRPCSCSYTICFLACLF